MESVVDMDFWSFKLEQWTCGRFLGNIMKDVTYKLSSNGTSLLAFVRLFEHNEKNILISFFITIIFLNDSCILGLFCIILSAPFSSLLFSGPKLFCPSFYCMSILKYWWEQKGGCKTWISIIAWRIKIIHSKSFDMIGSSSHCSTHIRTIYSWGPCCSWGTHHGSSDRHRSESCPRGGRTLSFFLWTEAIVIKYLNEIGGM